MSWVKRKIPKCDVCGHEWLTKIKPTYCAKCKSRLWNGSTDTAKKQVKQLRERIKKLSAKKK